MSATVPRIVCLLMVATVAACDDMPTRRLVGHRTRIVATAFNHQGSRLYSASLDGAVATWSVTTGRRLRVFWVDQPTPIINETFSPDATALATTDSLGVVRVWGVLDGRRVVALGSGGIPVSAVAFHPDGYRLASVSSDGALRLWAWPQETTGAPLPTGSNVLLGHQTNVSALAFAPDGSLLATGSTGGTIQVWSGHGERYVPLRTLTGHRAAVVALAFHPSSDFIASADEDGAVRRWSLVDSVKTFELQGRQGISSLAFHPSGTSLWAATSMSGRAAVARWETVPQYMSAVPSPHGFWVPGGLSNQTPAGQAQALAFSRDGRFQVVADDDVLYLRFVAGIKWWERPLWYDWPIIH